MESWILGETNVETPEQSIYSADARLAQVIF